MCHIVNIPTKFGEDWSNSKEMTTDFRNSRRRRPPSWSSVKKHFKCDICVLCQILNVSTKFGEDWSNSKEMATHFRNSTWRRPPSGLSLNVVFLIWQLRSTADSKYSHQIWWGVVQCIEVATDFLNSKQRWTPSWSLILMHFNCDSCVLGQLVNVSTKIGKDWSRSKGMATNFRNARWQWPPSSSLVNVHFKCYSCV